jgi:hypothetical protein
MRDDGWGSGGSPFPAAGSGNDYPSPALHPKDDAATAQVVYLFLILFLSFGYLFLSFYNFKLMMTGTSKRRAVAALFVEGNMWCSVIDEERARRRRP